MDKKLVYDFCLECTIPGVLTAYSIEDEDKMKEKLIDVVLKQAKTDANRGARNDDQCKFRGDDKSREDAYGLLKELLLTSSSSSLSSENIIKEITKKDIGVSNAFLQKFVNMTLKYIVVLQTIKDGIPGIIIHEDKCDCPVDSIILKTARKMNIYTDAVCWTKQTSPQYRSFQDCIKDYYSNPLEFDFKYWMR